MDPDALRGLGFSAVFIPWLYMTPYKRGLGNSLALESPESY